MKPTRLPSLPLTRTACAAGLVLLLAAPANAAPDSNPTERQQSSSSYTDRGYSTPSVTVTQSWGGGSPFYDSAYNHGWDRGSVHSGWASFHAQMTIQHRPIYLPPIPPALGEPVPAARPTASLKAVTLPAFLGSSIYEPFYAPLSTLLYTESLDRRRREKLDAFRAERTTLLAEIRAKLDSLQNADPETKRAELAALAGQQAARLHAQEEAAADIRTNLVNGSWLQAGVDWNDNREWRLGDNTRWESAMDELKVALGAAFFQEGLSGAQRHLLRELAMELADSLRAPDAEISLDEPGPYLYFSPFTARIRLPAEMPAELGAKIADYTARKTALKQALRDELYKQDRAFFNSTRSNALKALAAQQEPEFAALEQLAEEIRLGLAPLPNPARPPALPLPSPLVKRIAAYLELKSTWQKEMVSRLDEVRAALPDDRVEFSRIGGGVTIQIVPNRRAKDDTKAKREKLQAELAPFNAAHRTTYADLAREKELIQQGVLQTASTTATMRPAKSIDRLLVEFAHALGQQETWLRYADYETAVLQPGLSPEQRRLLFGAGLEKLDLPLLNR